MGGGEHKRLFISHGAKATAWAAGLIPLLNETEDIVAVTTAADTFNGPHPEEMLRQEVQAAGAIVLLLCPEPSEPEQYQLTEVLQAHWKDQSKHLLPILFGAATPPPFLRALASYRAKLQNPPDREVASWIGSQLDASTVTDATKRTKATSARPARPWVYRLSDDIDTRPELLRRLDATIATLSEERPDEEDLRENRESLQRSLEEKQEPKNLALAHLNIGLIDLSLRAHKPALEHLNRALEICESDAIEGYPNRVSILIPLAETLAEMQEYENALATMRQAARIRAEEEGPEARGVIAIEQELGALLVRAGEYEEAADLLTHTLTVNKQELGANHSQVEANELWVSLAQEQLHSRDPSAPQGFLGVEPLTKVTRLLGLGYTMIEIDDLCGAQAALARAVRLAEETPGIHASIRASCWFYNGFALFKTRQWQEAGEELRKAAEGNKEQGIQQGWAASMFYLGSALQENGETEEAVRVLSEVLAAAEKIYGPRSIEVADNRHNLGLALRDQGDYEEAREQIATAVLIGTELDGRDDPRVNKYQRSLARLDRVAA